jgi:malate dehydrogenase (oxaloacetate-decarboxylating)
MSTYVDEDGNLQGELEVSLTGEMLLNTPLLNKGSAFSEEERQVFGLVGLLPTHIASIEEQLARTYGNYLRKQDDLERYIFLAELQDRNEVLFYRLLSEHLHEMCPIVYTPVVGLACQQYSHTYRRPRGLYISYPHRDDIATILGNVPTEDVQVIVVTDGERILGLGDLGIGGMDIPVGKLTLYTACAGIHPATTLPILLDVGTDNQALLADPLYLGWHHERVRGADYDEFIEAFVQAVKHTYPRALLQWEDFAKGNARRLLNRYQQELCTFNDDIQGTGAVALAGLLAAVKRIGSTLHEQTVVILGAGSAATGIADQLLTAMTCEGLSPAAARAALWLIDRQGVVHTGRNDLEPEKASYAQPVERLAKWPRAGDAPLGLQAVVEQVHPTILIGTVAQGGAFTEPIVREMARHTHYPIIFPLSNPTAKSEAIPADLIAWTEGRALVATGSPFPDVSYGEQTISIGQCNNMFIFPGMGLGILAAHAQRVTTTMFLAAAHALSACSPALQSPTAPLYPPVEAVRDVAWQVAIAVGVAAQQAGVAEPTPLDELEQRVCAQMWAPHYPQLIRASAPE